MKKQVLIIGITIVLITVGLSGCSDNNLSSKSNQEKIIGLWEGIYLDANFTFQIEFYRNGSYRIGPTIEKSIWDTYAMTDTTFTAHKRFYTCEYFFSDNDNKLTLIDSEDTTWIFTRK